MSNEIATQNTADVVPFKPEPGAISPMVQLIASGQMPVDQVEQMLELQERYEANEARKAYNQSMTAFRQNVGMARKTGNNTHLGTRYATFDDLVAAVSNPLGAAGFNYAFKSEQVDGKVRVTCTITHAAGHSESTSLASAIEGNKGINGLQALGLTVSYLKRYTLSELTGIGTEDSDGQMPKADAPASTPAPAPVEQLTDAQESELVALIDACNEAKDGSGDRWRKAQVAKHGAADRPLGFTIPATWFGKAKESLTERLAGIRAEQAGGGDDA